MKVIVTYAIARGAHVLVSAGDEINPQTPLFQSSSEEKKEVIPVASILQIKEELIYKYLKKREGVKIQTGEILAEKKSLLSSSIIKAPVAGILKEIDLKRGTLTLAVTEGRTHKVTLPIRGKITKVTSGYLEIEIDGKSFKGEKGKGREVVGKLAFIDGGKVGTLDIKDNVEGCVVISKKFLPEAIVKLEVLEAVGFICREIISETELPWVIVTEENFNHLKSHALQNIWLRPEEKQIVILDI